METILSFLRALIHLCVGNRVMSLTLEHIYLQMTGNVSFGMIFKALSDTKRIQGLIEVLKTSTMAFDEMPIILGSVDPQVSEIAEKALKALQEAGLVG